VWWDEDGSESHIDYNGGHNGGLTTNPSILTVIVRD
jgi:hypothetical protein